MGSASAFRKLRKGRGKSARSFGIETLLDCLFARERWSMLEGGRGAAHLNGKKEAGIALAGSPPPSFKRPGRSRGKRKGKGWPLSPSRRKNVFGPSTWNSYSTLASACWTTRKGEKGKGRARFIFQCLFAHGKKKKKERNFLSLMYDAKAKGTMTTPLTEKCPVVGEGGKKEKKKTKRRMKIRDLLVGGEEKKKKKEGGTSVIVTSAAGSRGNQRQDWSRACWPTPRAGGKRKKQQRDIKPRSLPELRGRGRKTL